MKIEKIDTRTNVSDVGTEALDQRRLHELLRLLSVGSSSDPARHIEQLVSMEGENDVDCSMSVTESQHIENVRKHHVLEVHYIEDMLGMRHPYQLVVHVERT